MKKRHVELVKRQESVVHAGLKACIVFEGRDGAGKGDTIKAITERVSPRVFRVVTLPAPTGRERTPMDLLSYGRWYDCPRSCDKMFAATATVTDTDLAPWYTVRSDDMKRAWLNVIQHIQSHIEYKMPERQKPDNYVNADHPVRYVHELC